MKRIKKGLVVWFTLITFTFGAGTAHAIIPAILCAGLPPLLVELSLLAHAVAGGAAGAWWYYKRGQDKTTTSNGDVKAVGDVTWVDLSSDGLPQTQHDPTIKAKVNAQDMIDKRNTDSTTFDSKYPQLKDALRGQLPYPDLNQNSNVNDIVTVPGFGQKKVTGKTPYSGAVEPGSTNAINQETFLESYANWSEFYYNPTPQTGDKVFNNRIHFTYTSDATPLPTVNYNKAQATSKLQGLSPSVAPVASATTPTVYSGNIDDFIKDNPNIVKYEDSSGGDATQQLPSNALTNDQITAIKNSGADSKTKAADALKGLYDAAVTTYGAGSNEAKAAYGAWQNALGGAQSASSGATGLPTGTGSGGSGSGTAVAYTPPSAGTAPARKALNFDKFKDLKDGFAQVGPYPLVQGLSNFYSMLVAEPVAPSFDLPVYGNTMHVDLSPFDSVAAVVRWFLALLLTIGMIFYAVRFWRGVS